MPATDVAEYRTLPRIATADARPDQWSLVCERSDAVLDPSGVVAADDLFRASPIAWVASSTAGRPPRAPDPPGYSPLRRRKLGMSRSDSLYAGRGSRLPELTGSGLRSEGCTS